jgi:4-amino-4-deoxy-L-arabinose transferase-like glycosyltransferase
VVGTGLWQARAVVAIYSVATLVVFFLLARTLGGSRLAWVASALLIGSRGVALLEYGRQVLGEVPGLFFVVAGLAAWFTAWERASVRRLVAVGVLLGLAVVTKTQYFIILAPALALGWVLNLVYYRSAPQKVFLIPGILVGVCFALWQSYVIVFLGPGAVSENLALYREATASAATVFSTDLMSRSLRELLSLKVYLSALAPILLYGLFVIVPRNRAGQQWGLVWIIIAVNLLWYVIASVSWLRYAFVGLALSSLFAARFFHDLTGGFQLDLKALLDAWRQGRAFSRAQALAAVGMAWLAAMILVPLAQSTRPIALSKSAENYPLAMADYMNANVPREALVETWEPEMGFLTDHTYHYPPQRLLYRAVTFIWAGGPAPATDYTFVLEQKPQYVLAGVFSKYVAFYPSDWLTGYQVVTEIGPYTLYKRQ